MTVMVLGDTHGNSRWVNTALSAAKDKGATKVVQVGDYGFWEHMDKGAFSDHVNEVCNTHDIDFYWIDGNHENHPLLWKQYTDTDDEGFVVVRDRVRYIPRGHVWDWNGKRCMGVGGAVSIDKDWRLEETARRIKAAKQKNDYRARAGDPTEFVNPKDHELWWATESLMPDEVNLAKSRGKVDLLFTHDAPTNVPMANLKVDIQSQIHRQLMNNIAESAQPKMWFHGHYHRRMTYPFYLRNGAEVQVEGLGCDGDPQSWVFLNL